jgi:hypothetical protein
VTLIKAFRPRDEIEGMLTIRIAAVQSATMRLLKQATEAQSPDLAMEALRLVDRIALTLFRQTPGGDG